MIPPELSDDDIIPLDIQKNMKDATQQLIDALDK